MFQILLLENDDKNTRYTQYFLKHTGYNVFRITGSAEMLDVLDNHHIDLIILDLICPTKEHYQSVMTLRTNGITIPIFMLTGSQLLNREYHDILSCVDDFLLKPFKDDELLLRISALLRRTKSVSERRLQFHNLLLDYDTLTISRYDEKIVLPQKEFHLLYKLLSCPDKIFTRTQLMNEIWGVDSNTIHTTINVHITRLRKRLAAWNEIELVTIRGVGYKATIHYDRLKPLS